MKKYAILAALVGLSGCAMRPTVPNLVQESENVVSVAAFDEEAEGTALHLHQNVCHSTKNATKTKTYKKCDKLRIAEGVIIGKSSEGGVRVKLDKPVKISTDMYFEESGVPMKAY